VESTDSAFIRKALNLGLPVIPCPGITGIVETGDEVEVNLKAGEASNVRTGTVCRFQPFTESVIEVWRLGGLAPALRARIDAASS
jgi:3-isopropylmalate/(R)-2-methylmalate dehydratase small subunit